MLLSLLIYQQVKNKSGNFNLHNVIPAQPQEVRIACFSSARGLCSSKLITVRCLTSCLRVKQKRITASKQAFFLIILPLLLLLLLSGERTARIKMALFGLQLLSMRLHCLYSVLPLIIVVLNCP